MAKTICALEYYNIFWCKRKDKKNCRPEFATWGLSVLVQYPVGADIRKLILDPKFRCENGLKK